MVNLLMTHHFRCTCISTIHLQLEFIGLRYYAEAMDKELKASAWLISWLTELPRQLTLCQTMTAR